MSYHDLKELKRPIVCVSGGFDFPHFGHTRLFEDAAKHGSLIVILNSDSWLIRKKGHKVMDWYGRCEVLRAFRSVQAVSPVNDMDGTVCEALERIKPEYFANGGDRTDKNTPEKALCEKLGIKMLWNMGGEKAASSQGLVNAIQKA